MSYKSSYKLIDIVFTKNNRTGEYTYETVCEKEFEIEVKHPDRVSYIHHEYYEHPPGRSSEIIEKW